MFAPMLAFLRRQLQRRPPPPPPAVRLVEREPCRLTLSEWRGSPDLVRQAARVLAQTEVRQMLDVLRHNHPALDVSSEMYRPEVRSVLLGRVEGYQMALNNLEALASVDKPQESLQATFEPPEKEDAPPDLVLPET